MHRQPWLHDFEIAVHGPSTVLSTHDGQIGAPGTGWFVDDRRVLSVLDLGVDEERTTAVASDTLGSRAEFWAVARHLGDPTPDPTVEVHRRRELIGASLVETITLVSRASEDVACAVRLRVGGDGAELSAVKGGRADGLSLLTAAPGATGSAVGLTWSDERHATCVRSSVPATLGADDPAGGTILEWPVQLAPHTSWTVAVTLTVERVARTSFDSRPGAGLCDLSAVGLDGDAVLDTLIRTNFADLQQLAQSDPDDDGDVFAAAGSPWYLTLFGRDSLWTARFMLPFAPQLALGTLRALARRQARADDAETSAEVGKILHEVRRGSFANGDFALPPLYYGTVDATPLWICLLHDAWRWGLDLEQVREFLPALQGCLGWMERMTAEAEDGFLRYVDATGRGLSNQGWKDSGDSMRRSDGSISPAPIALVEAQAYAVEAAYGAAALLEALGEDGASDWRDWAVALSDRVRERFWVEAEEGPYLAMALDAQGERVDGVGSNMGHTLGTGMLTAEEEDRVVRRLMQPDMLRHFGIATLSAENPAYNPIGYHTGSVWTHDTAIILRGLVETGHRAEADAVIEALLRLSTSVRHRFPELVAGDPVGQRPVPYPASCRPQAWAAASAAVIVTALLGLQVDVPAGLVRTDPSSTLPTTWSLRGVRVASEPRAFGPATEVREAALRN